jgi:hypothetical protein
VIDLVERGSQVCIKYPQASTLRAACGYEDCLHRVLTTASRSEPIRSGFEPGLPLGFQRVDRQGLKRSVGDHRNPESSLFSVCLRDEHPPDGSGLPTTRAVLEPGSHLGLVPGLHHHASVDPGRLAASVDLRYPSRAQQSVRAGTQHQLLQVADPLEVPCLRRREDPLAQPPYVVLDPTPIHGVPVQDLALRSVHHPVSNLPIGSDVSVHLICTDSPDPRQRPFGPGKTALSDQLCGNHRRRCQRTVPGFLLPFAVGICFLGHPAPAGELSLPHGRPTGDQLTGPHRGCRVAHEQDPTGQGAPFTPGTVVRSRPATLPPAGTCRSAAASPYGPTGTSHRWG